MNTLPNTGIGRERIPKNEENVGGRSMSQEGDLFVEHVGNPLRKWKRNVSRRLSVLAAKMVFENTKNLKICIFSNDCWGAEFYRCTGRPYNTPFVGLMLMAPCYLKFLKNPKHYLEQDLRFTIKSKYPEHQEFREQVQSYPVGLLEEIEVHFLHYRDAQQALESWKRRKARIDWDHLYVKFSMDKDYADQDLLHAFEMLPYRHKISFSKDKYNSPVNVQLKNYSHNGARLFTHCFEQVDLLQWFYKGEIRSNNLLKKIRGYFISKFLKVI